ncbi:MAG: hypothetical protein COA84_07720 [Robiginitomaculum sp.]|nr:MAG: hypothetical protein COA84_07720 [Robiginitomaculum sp.]
MIWPADPYAPVCAAQVAKRLGKASTNAFYRARPALRKQGFPEPVFGRKWTGGQIDQWIALRLAIVSAGPATEQPANDSKQHRGRGNGSARKRIAQLATGANLR